MAEERSMREAELEKVGAALSSTPTRAGQMVAVGAAAVGFITSSAVMGDLSWYTSISPRWQLAVLCLAGLQVGLVVTALVLCLTVAPPDAVGLYQGPSPTQQVVRKRTWLTSLRGEGRGFTRRMLSARWWKPVKRSRLLRWLSVLRWIFWRQVVRSKSQPSPLQVPISFADEACDKILASAGTRIINQIHVDEYMAMIAFLQASEDSDLLHRRRKTMALAATCVAIAAICGGFILIVAGSARLGSATVQRDQSAQMNVIMNARSYHVLGQSVPKKSP
jgi:hypothetical protein